MGRTRSTRTRGKSKARKREQSKGRGRDDLLAVIPSYIRPDWGSSIAEHVSRGQPTSKADDGRACDIGLDRTPTETKSTVGVLSPISKTRSTPIGGTSKPPVKEQSKGRGRDDYIPSYIRCDLDSSRADHADEVHTTSKADEGRECDIGLDRTPSATNGTVGVLSPIDKKLSKPPIGGRCGVRVLQPPKHCHTYKSRWGISSQRTRAAVGAFFRWCTSQLFGRDLWRNRIKAKCRKYKKQRSRLLFVELDEKMRECGDKFPTGYLRRNIVVFDGGGEGMPPLKNVNQHKRWKSVRIQNGGLKVIEPPCAGKGVAYQGEGDMEPRFILLPREDVLKINADCGGLCAAMRRIMKSQRGQRRGKSKQIYSDHKYCCVGSKPRRSAPGVEPGQYRVEDGGFGNDWDVLMRGIRRGEHAFDGFVGSDVIRQMKAASSVVPWERPESTSGKCCKIFNGIAFGVNVHLRAHQDHDFTYSVIEVHVEGEKYGHDDRVVCYFCFPQLGCAVPMRPGDILLMNPMEYHCVSSLCQNDVDVYGVSCYLKTAVVGGNDNKRKLNGEESECLGAFDDAVRLMKMNTIGK